MEIKLFSKWRPYAILNLRKLPFWSRDRHLHVILHLRSKIRIKMAQRYSQYMIFNFPFRAWKFDKKAKFFKFKMADGRHIEYRFWLYLGALLADQREIRKGDEESHTNTGHVTKTAIFAN